MGRGGFYCFGGRGPSSFLLKLGCEEEALDLALNFVSQVLVRCGRAVVGTGRRWRGIIRVLVGP